ncbi:MAG: metallophosphoesterase family protein [Ruminococcus sp.]|nr:metallophosphoesterase family protein [Ruminococcus sp.]
MSTEEKTKAEAPDEPPKKQKKKWSKRKKIVLSVFGVLLVLIIAEFIRSNTVIQVEEFTFESEDVPPAFDGVRIVQISDYHNHGGSHDDRLIKKIEAQHPDYIFLTGDIADSILTHIDRANAFLERVSKIADCYLVWGNHDLALSEEDRNSMAECCRKNGITVLEDEYIRLTRGDDSLLLVGTKSDMGSYFTDIMMKDYPSGEDFVIWLHHYPEDFEEIVDESKAAGSQADLAFCGHAHGGLVRLPVIGGLVAPGQGLFPKYTSGDYYYDGSELLLSRGVGNSGVTLRFLDPFHLVVCELKRTGG